MSEQEKSSYRQVVKATSVFGGVQVFTIAVGLIRAKLVAVLLGVSGYGIHSLLNVPLVLIASLTGLGISYSAIRNISEAHSEGDQERFGRTITVFRRWVWVTGLLGMIVTLCLAPLLSRSSFGNGDYTWAFAILSVTLLLNALSGGQSSVLYGTRKIGDISKATITGSVLGLIVSVPLYYFYGLKGIAPSIILVSSMSLLSMWYFSRRVPVIPAKISYRESFHEGISFVKIGFMMTVTALMGSSAVYLINAFLSHRGGEMEVGLYNAGWIIAQQYTGMIFTAMSADYYPRLSAVNKDRNKVKSAVNQQAEIGILVLGPIMIMYLISLPLMIPLLYTDDFLKVIPFMQWITMGMLLKVIGWSLGFIALAMGKSALYFKLELIATLIQVLSIIGGYTVWGLEGIGVAFVLTYILYVLYMFLFYRKVYGFSFSASLLKPFLVMQGFCVAGFMAVKFLPSLIAYSLNGLFLLLALWYSLYELNKRIDLRDILGKISGKFRSKASQS